MPKIKFEKGTPQRVRFDHITPDIMRVMKCSDDAVTWKYKHGVSSLFSKRGSMLAGILISVILFSSNVYFNNAAFALGDSKNLTELKKQTEEKALVKFGIKYQHANMAGSKVNWSGLTSTTTDSTSRERNLDAQAQTSMEKALAEFNQVHVTQLIDLNADRYLELSNVPTNMDGRDRNTMIAQSRQPSLVQSDQLVPERAKLNSAYINLEQGDTTNSDTGDRQAQIQKAWNDMEKKSTNLVDGNAKINPEYVNLIGGPTTDSKSKDRNLDSAQKYSQAKAVMKFEFTHVKHLNELQSNYYGLSNTPTDTNGKDRTLELEKAKEVSLQKAIRVNNAYYPAYPVYRH